MYTFSQYCDAIFSPSSKLAEYDTIVFYAHHAQRATPLTMLTSPEGITHVYASAQTAQESMMHKECPTLEAFLHFLRANRYVMHAPDRIYLAKTLQSAPISPASCVIRPLTGDDEAAFTRFCNAVDDDELDHAFVELDHWRVWGVFVDSSLMAVASAYRWQESRLADFGVVTLSSHRNLGFAKMLLRQAFFEVQQDGYLVQFRSQLDNRLSHLLAESLNLLPVGQWQPMLFQNRG